MRKEFFRYVYSPEMTTLWVLFGVLWGAVAGSVLSLVIWKSATPPPLVPALAVVGIIAIFWVVWMAWAISATSPRWRKRSMTCPLLIIDDRDLWFREIGELMPWIEIESIRFDRWGEDEPFEIVCKSPHAIPPSVARKNYSDGKGNIVFCVGDRLGYMDRDGVFWRPRSIYKMMMERWKQTGAAKF